MPYVASLLVCDWLGARKPLSFVSLREVSMGALFNAIFNFVIYISIPVAVRYVILHRPIRNKWIAMGILVPIFIGFATLIGAQREEGQKRIYQQLGVPVGSAPHMIGSPILYVAIFASYFILSRRRSKHAPFLLAAADGNIEEVTRQLSNGAVIDQRGPAGETALMLAARNNQIDCVKLLLTKGADPALRTPKNSSAEDVARRFGHKEIAELLAIQNGGSPPSNQSSQ